MTFEVLCFALSLRSEVTLNLFQGLCYQDIPYLHYKVKASMDAEISSYWRQPHCQGSE